MILKTSLLQGCFELQPKVLDDSRGRFVKVFNNEIFREYDLETNFAEEYYSVSYKNVIRGMHFQVPPADHVKLVYCVQGKVMDVVIDLRVDSPTYCHHAVFQLNASNANAVYIPKGMAHGFCVLSNQAILVYKVSSIYSPENDTGILWNSAGIDWSVNHPILSERDQNFSPLNDFASPFKI